MFDRKISSVISSGFGSGFSPFAPGTCGSAVMAVVWILAMRANLLPDIYSRIIFAVLITIIGLVGVYASLKHDSSNPDPGWIVIDEWAGMAWALIFWPTSAIFGVCASFALFRLFDIWKPGPIRRSEKLPGAWGIMMDDILAGLCSAALIWLARITWSV